MDRKYEYAISLVGNVLTIAAVRIQVLFSTNNHYRFSEAQAFGFSIQPSWRHTGLLDVRPFSIIVLSETTYRRLSVRTLLPYGANIRACRVPEDRYCWYPK